LLDRRSVDAAEVDVREGDRSGVLEDVIGWDAAPGGTSPIEHLVELPGVVGDHYIRQQRQGATDEHQFFASPATISTDRPVVNRALELMDGFPTHQKSIDCAAKRRLRRIVAQVYGVPRLIRSEEAAYPVPQ
jgi:hypothetical protein